MEIKNEADLSIAYTFIDALKDFGQKGEETELLIEDLQEDVREYLDRKEKTNESNVHLGG